MEKAKYLIIFSMISTLLMGCMGLTYAIFRLQVTGNENASSIVTKLGSLKLNYVDGNYINMPDIIGGWSATKTITVENTGTYSTAYDIIWENIENTYVNKELLTYTITNAGAGGSLSQTQIPNSAVNRRIINNISIAPGVTHTYTITFNYELVSSDQSSDMKKVFAGKLKIVEPNLSIAKDYSGNNRNGTINGATFTNQGLYFDGTDDYVQLPSTLGATFPATYSMKFKTNAVGNQILFGDYSTFAALGLFSSNNSLILSLGNSYTNISETGNFALDTFYTIDLVYESLNNISVYINGNKIDAKGTNNYWTWDTAVSYIGKRPTGTFFKGTIEKFIVYDDVLTQAEVLHNLNATNGTICNNGVLCDNLTLYYDFSVNN